MFKKLYHKVVRKLFSESLIEAVRREDQQRQELLDLKKQIDQNFNDAVQTILNIITPESNTVYIFDNAIHPDPEILDVLHDNKGYKKTKYYELTGEYLHESFNSNNDRLHYGVLNEVQRILLHDRVTKIRAEIEEFSNKKQLEMAKLYENVKRTSSLPGDGKYYLLFDDEGRKIIKEYLEKRKK